MTEFDYDRRKVLAASGAALTIGLAGCSGGGDDDDDGGNGGGNGGTSREDFMSDANNYDGSLEDMTGSDEVTITVGEGGNQYTPAGAEISTGTTVIWEWAEGGHSVTAESGADFDSSIQQNSGATFEQTFDEAGEILYFCQPHRSQGHKGVLNVV